MPLTDAEKAELASLRQKAGSVEQEPGFGEKAGAFTYGAATGLAGGLGELEKFGAYDVPEFFGAEPKREDMGFGRETLFPTVKEAQTALSKVGIQRPREEVSGYETAGEIIGGLGTSLPKIAKTGAKAALGVPSAAREATAKTAEKLGFKLSPAQVRRDVPVAAKGATGWSAENQTLANKLASASTGKEVAEITPEFVRGRIRDLGSEFDKVYKGKIFNIDPQAIQALDAIRSFETQLPPSQQLAAVRNTADSIVKRFSQMASRQGAQPSTFAIEGDALQTIRNDLMAAARSASDRSDAHRLYELIDAIDSSVARNHPQVAAKLNELRPLYRNTVILEDLLRQKGIRGGDISLESLGNMLGSTKQAVRRVGGELDQLGEIGRELQLRARWQKEVTDAGLPELLRATLGKGAALLGLRSRPARAVQRVLEEGAPMTKKERAAMGTAAGTVTRPFQAEEQ